MARLALGLAATLIGMLLLASPALSATHHFGGTGNEVTLTDVDGPTATINTPRDGDIYALRQLVSTSFGCSDGAGGSGLLSCVDQEGHYQDQHLLDTSTPGKHSFTVTATSNDGLTGTATSTYTVTSQDVRCPALRDKLKRQKRGLAKAKKQNKRAFIQHNIGQTKTRLRALGCS